MVIWNYQKKVSKMDRHVLDFTTIFLGHKSVDWRYSASSDKSLRMTSSFLHCHKKKSHFCVYFLVDRLKSIENISAAINKATKKTQEPPPREFLNDLFWKFSRSSLGNIQPIE